MESHDGSSSLALAAGRSPGRFGGHRAAWHALAVLLAGTVAWLIFTAYRQPDLLLDLAALRLC